MEMLHHFYNMLYYHFADSMYYIMGFMMVLSLVAQ